VRISLTYDVGNGPLTVKISPRAVVGWELETKQKASDLGNGMGMGDLSTMLWQQLRLDEANPFSSQAELLDALVDIDPEIAAGAVDPTPPAPPPD
jgi:hypothetical protein